MTHDIFWLVNIAEINECFGVHCCPQLTKFKDAKNLPFGNDNKGVSTCCRIMDVIGEVYVLKQGPCCCHAGLIIDP